MSLKIHKANLIDNAIEQLDSEDNSCPCCGCDFAQTGESYTQHVRDTLETLLNQYGELLKVND